MADRYAVAAGGNWSSTSTWSTTDGGAGGASVPTSSDDVYLTATSGAVTTANGDLCKSLICTGYTNTLTIGGTFSIYGGLTLSAAMTLAGSGWVMAFRATDTNGGAGWPITSNGKAIPRAVSFNGVGGKWTLQDSFVQGSSGGSVTLTNGTLDTNNQSVTCIAFFLAAGTKTLTLGSSTVTVTGFSSAVIDFQQYANFTLTANTATFVLNGASSLATMFGFNMNGASIQFTGGGTSGFGNQPAGTWNNVTYTGTAVKTDQFQLGGNLTVTGTFTVTGNSTTNRVLVLSSTLGTTRVITAGATSLTNVDFMDIAMVGPVGSTITSDSFNRADGAIGTSDAAYGGTGVAWSQISGSNTVYSNTVKGGGRASVELGTADQYVSVKVNTSSAPAWQGIGARYADNNNFIYFVVNGTASYAGTVVGGSDVGNYIAGAPSISNGDTIALAVNGSTCHWLINGAVVKTQAVSASLNGTKAIISFSASTGTLDDFKAWPCPAVTGTSLGDCGGNSGITFTTNSGTARDGGGPGVKRYAVAAGNWSSTATWSETDGGAAGASVPLPQDDVYLTANSGAGTYAMDMPRSCRNLDCTGFTRTLRLDASFNIYGSLTFSAGMSYAMNSKSVWFRGRGSHTITTAGKLYDDGAGTEIVAVNGTYTLADDWTAGSMVSPMSAPFVDHLAGTLNLSGHTMKLSRYIASGALSRSLLFNGATVTVGYSNNMWTISGSNYSTDGTGNVVVAPNGANVTFIGGSLTYNSVTYTQVDSPGTLTFTGANTIGTLNVGAGRTVQFPPNAQTTIGTLNVTPSQPGYFYTTVNNWTASSPDSVPLSITGDIDIRFRVKINSWVSNQVYVTKYVSTSSDCSFYVMTNVTGRLNLYLSADGTTAVNGTATVDLPVTLPWQGWLRTTWVQSTGTVQLLYADDSESVPSSWTQIGANGSIVIASIYNSAADLRVGISAASTTGGRFYRCQIRNGIDGTVVYDADFANKTPCIDTFTESSSNAATVTINPSQNLYGDGRVVLTSSTAGSPALVNLTNELQTNYVDVKDVCVCTNNLWAGATSSVRTNVRGAKTVKNGIMV